MRRGIINGLAVVGAGVLVGAGGLTLRLGPRGMRAFGRYFWIDLSRSYRQGQPVQIIDRIKSTLDLYEAWIALGTYHETSVVAEHGGWTEELMDDPTLDIIHNPATKRLDSPRWRPYADDLNPPSQVNRREVVRDLIRRIEMLGDEEWESMTDRARQHRNDQIEGFERERDARLDRVRQTYL